MSSIAHSKSITVDLDKPLVRVNVGGVMATGDKKADQYSVTITRSGANVSLTGCSVYGYMILPNDETLKIEGTASGNTASVIVPQSGYAYDGAFTLAIKVSGTDFKATIALFDGTIAQTVTETLVDGDRVLYGADEILALISDMEEAEEAANTAATAANTAATSANEKAAAANTAASNANTQASAAQEAAANANAKATAADTAASAANTAAAKIEGMTVEATGLDAGVAPTAAVSEVNGHKHIAFGIPKGDAGEKGDKGDKGDKGEKGDKGDPGSGSVSTVDGIQPDGGDVQLGAVRYNAAQSLSDAQKQQARDNIGAGTGQGTVKTVDGETPDAAGGVQISAVRYTAQTLTEGQQTQARGNIGAASAANYTATLTVAGWSDATPSTQTATVTGLLADDTPIIDVDTSAATTEDDLSALADAWATVLKATASAGQLTVTASAAPEVAIPIKIKVVR